MPHPILTKYSRIRAQQRLQTSLTDASNLRRALRAVKAPAHKANVQLHSLQIGLSDSV